MSLFAAKQSGAAAMFESMIPASIKEAINNVAQQLPAFIKDVDERIKTIETRQNEMNEKLDILLGGKLKASLKTSIAVIDKQKGEQCQNQQQ
jgi:hypothetical protein